MKKQILSACLFTAICMNVFSQEDIAPIITITHTGGDMKEYKQMFSELNSKLITTGFLSDKTFQLVPFANYDGSDTARTITNKLWKFLYAQIRESQIQSNSIMPTIDSIYYPYFKKLQALKSIESIHEIRRIKEKITNEEFVPIAVIDVFYNEMRQDAFDKKLLEFTELKKLKETQTKKDESPYETKNVFAAVALNDRVFNGNEVTFLLDKAFYFTNKNIENALYEIDFDDGIGFRKIQFGQKIQVSYPSIGEKNIRFKKREIVESNNKLLYSSNNQNFMATSLLSVAAQSIPLPSFTINATELKFFIPTSYPHGGVNVQGTAYVYTSDGTQNIDNPIIISDGFDPLNDRGRDSLYVMINQENLIECLRANGYDVIILDFANGGDYIERNAYLLKGLIENINARKTTQNKLIVVGTSMAGLISRYALAYMEKNGIDHDTRLYVSFDSPEKGANIPLGIQYWAYFFADMNEQVQNLYNNMLCCPAALQMLIYHVTNHSYRENFIQNLNNIGYPSNLRKIAIANGAGNAYAQRKDNGIIFNPTDQIINWRYRHWDVDIDGNSWALPDYSPSTKIFYGNINIVWYAELFVSGDQSLEVTISGTKPYDNAPGGFNPTAGQIADSDTDGRGDITTEISNHCFIPTISSLAIETSNLFYNISADPNILSKTPFDAIYYPFDTNEKHANISPECVAWLLNELVPEYIELDGVNDSWNKGNVTASSCITLKPGFSTVSGTTFHAYISPPLSCNSSSKSSKYFNSFVDNTFEKTYVEEKLKNSTSISVSVFPNPNNGKFYIHISNSSKTGSIEIRNVQGVKILQINCISNQSEYYTDISNFPNGIYFVSLRLEDKTQTFKIIKQ
jgi:hypothetical protein